jgi:hypothetical protein
MSKTKPKQTERHFTFAELARRINASGLGNSVSANDDGEPDITRLCPKLEIRRSQRTRRMRSPSTRAA